MFQSLSNAVPYETRAVDHHGIFQWTLSGSIHSDMFVQMVFQAFPLPHTANRTCLQGLAIRANEDEAPWIFDGLFGAMLQQHWESWDCKNPWVL